MSLMQKTVRADVQATQAYVVAPAQGMVKLDAMENPQGMPTELLDALADALKAVALNRYPEPKAASLEAALRAHSDIPKAAQVLFGNGSDELIDLIIRACCMPGDVVMSPVPTFVMYAVYSQWSHAQFVGVDLNPDFTLNMPALLKAISAHQPKVVFLAYPNNPTGVALREAEIVQVIKAAPGLVVVDEAYEAFADASFMSRVLEFPNVLVLRTFSKLGLAGVRLGYAVASSAWAEQIDKVRPPYNVNVLTRTAVEFALKHFDAFEAQAAQLKSNRETLREALQSLQNPQLAVEVFDSCANFLLFRLPNALEVFEGLKKKGILIKYVGKAHPLLANCLRVTVSTEHENQQFLDALKQTLAELAQ
ncbi:MAG TPA: histidinol-phosphate transaminase [Limnobacter sp.]|uniref:histidinol-phosphate transaminase n=1 Tax=Limnobacter sp. TaxID=2003368 RepID=UPI002ED7968E